ncbi:MAG: tyrosine-type recombinase/integrase [Dehalococcoidia bacterium]
MESWEDAYYEHLGSRSLVEWLAVYGPEYLEPLQLAARTREEYCRDVGACLAFLAQHRDVVAPHQVSITDLRAYAAWLDERGLSATACRRQVAALRSFLHFLYQQYAIAHDLAARLMPPPRMPRPLRILTPDECDRLRAVSAGSARDAALIGLLLGAGLRLNELRNLRSADVTVGAARTSDEKPMVQVRGVPHRCRMLALDTTTATALSAYLAQRPLTPGGAVFVSKFRRPLSIRGVRLVVVAALLQAGISDASVHTLRHTFAVHQLQAGVSLADLPAVLGHASAKTTARYASLVSPLQAAQAA